MADPSPSTPLIRGTIINDRLYIIQGDDPNAFGFGKMALEMERRELIAIRMRLLGWDPKEFVAFKAQDPSAGTDCRRDHCMKIEKLLRERGALVQERVTLPLREGRITRRQIAARINRERQEVEHQKARDEKEKMVRRVMRSVPSDVLVFGIVDRSIVESMTGEPFDPTTVALSEVAVYERHRIGETPKLFRFHERKEQKTIDRMKSYYYSSTLLQDERGVSIFYSKSWSSNRELGFDIVDLLRSQGRIYRLLPEEVKQTSEK